MAPAAPSDGSGGHGSCSGSAPGMDGFTGASQGATAAASPSATQASAVRERFMYIGDINSVWSHGIRIGTQGFKCLYCRWEYNGGAATRFAEHLASLGKQVRPCDRVPREVRAAIRKMRLEKKEKKREDEERDIRFERELVQEMHGHDIIDIDDVSDDLEVRTPLAVERSLRDLELRHEVERRPGTFEHGFGSGSSNTTRGGGQFERHLRKRSSASSGSCGSISGIGRGKVTSQQRIDVAMDKTKIAKIGEAWARWFHANEIPGRKANCYYFRAALRLSMEIGLVLPLPNGSDIDGKYLDASCMEMEDYIRKL